MLLLKSENMLYSPNMAQTNEKWAFIRVKPISLKRLKVKGARDKKKLWEVVDDMSKNQCI